MPQHQNRTVVLQSDQTKGIFFSVTLGCQEKLERKKQAPKIIKQRGAKACAFATTTRQKIYQQVYLFYDRALCAPSSRNFQLAPALAPCRVFVGMMTAHIKAEREARHPVGNLVAFAIAPEYGIGNVSSLKLGVDGVLWSGCWRKDIGTKSSGGRRGVKEAAELLCI